METDERSSVERGFSPEMIGMLILNELKCLRKELTQEVRILGQKLDSLGGDKVATTNYNFGDSIKEEQNENDFIEETSDDILWSPIEDSLGEEYNDATEPERQVEQSSFREILPHSHNSILNSHIAFRLSSCYSKSPNENVRSQDSLVATKSTNSDYNNTDDFLPSSVDSPSGGDQHSVPINLSNEVVGNRNNTNFLKYSISYTCNFCSEEFKSQLDYNCHYSNRHRDTETQSTDFDDQTLLPAKLHYICGVCSCRLSAKGSLLRHNMLHSGVKRFICKICGKAFSRSDHLKSHMPTHTRERPHCCRICQKSFSRQQNLHKHMKMHDKGTVTT